MTTVPMTTATEPVVGDATTVGSRAASRWNRWRVALLVAVLAVVAGTAAVVVQPRTGGGALDPGSAAPSGSRALAQVLSDRGVDVERVDRVEDAVAAGGEGTTLLVVDPSVLEPDRLEQLGQVRWDVVLVAPDGPVLAELAPGLEPAGVVGEEVRAAGCDDPDAGAAGEALAGGSLVRAAGEAPATLCFGDPDDPDAGAYAVVESVGRETTVLGQSGVLTNERLDADGNAALAVRTLGGNPRLVWLMASPLDTAGDAEITTTDLLPAWVPWVAAQLAVVALLAIAWRSRRLGRLVDEPLPVVVRAAETAEGRAALYRSAGARHRAAAVLRAATLRRLAARLGLPAGAEASDVAAQAARASGRDRRDVHDLLLGPPPDSGGDLVALADRLDALAADLEPHPRGSHRP